VRGMPYCASQAIAQHPGHNAAWHRSMDLGGHVSCELKADSDRHLNLILGDRFERVISVSADALVDR
jgi:hypothetical protein